MKSETYKDVADDPQYFDGAEALMIMLGCAK